MAAKLILALLATLASFLLMAEITAQKPAISSHMARFLCGQTRQYGRTGKIQGPIKRAPSQLAGLACGWWVKRGKGDYYMKPCDGSTPSTRACTVRNKAKDEPQKSYKGHQVWRITPATNKDLNNYQAALGLPGLKTLSGPYGVGFPTDVLVAPSQLAEFKRKRKNVNAQLLIKDVQLIIDKNTRLTRNFDLKNFNTWQTIHGYFEAQQEKYPKLAKVIDYGMSHECRPLKALRISKTGAESNPVIFIESAIHPREWITTAAALYLANELLNGEDATIKGWLDTYDFIITGPVNIDGYSYTFTHDRLWRKTRSTNNGSECVGTDANRNWEYNWGVGQTSNDPCAESYHGSAPFSEPSVKYLAGLLETVGDRLAFYFALHSYAQVWIIPYAYSAEKFPFYEDDKELGDKVAAAMKIRNNREYKVGTLQEVLGVVVGGSSMDYAKLKYKQASGAAIELPPMDGAGSGFIPPPEDIEPISLELIDGLKVYIEGLQSDDKRSGSGSGSGSGSSEA